MAEAAHYLSAYDPLKFKEDWERHSAGWTGFVLEGLVQFYAAGLQWRSHDTFDMDYFLLSFNRVNKCENIFIFFMNIFHETSEDAYIYIGGEGGQLGQGAPSDFFNFPLVADFYGGCSFNGEDEVGCPTEFVAACVFFIAQIKASFFF